MNPYLLAMQLIDHHINFPSWFSQHSYIDYHVPGIDYLCLHREPALTVKAYMFSKLRLEPDPNGWIVWPHTHRYTFEHVTLTGNIDNVVFSLGEPGERVAERYGLFTWDSEERTAKRIALAGLKLKRTEKCWQTKGFIMKDPDELHTLIVHEDSIALQFQYTSAKHDSSIMCVPAPLTPKVRAYKHPNAETALAWATKVRTALRDAWSQHKDNEFRAANRIRGLEQRMGELVIERDRARAGLNEDGTPLGKTLGKT